MATPFTLISNKKSTAANSIQIMYTASKATQITKFTATNDTGVNRSYRAYIYDSTGTATGSSVPTKFVTSLKGFDLAPTIVGHVVPKGGTIRVESSAANSLTFRATGELLEN